MKTLITSVIFILFLFLFSFNIAQAQTQVILKEWASYAGPTDSVFKTPVVHDGDYTYVATFTGVTDADVLILKYDNNGDTIWKQQWQGAGHGRDQAAGLALHDSSIYICGTSMESVADNYDYFTMRLNQNDGQMRWVTKYNGTASNYDAATAIEVNDSGVFVTGLTNDSAEMLNFTTIKYSHDGVIVWTAVYNNSNANMMDIPFEMTLSGDSELVVTGGSQNNLYDWDYQTVYYDLRGNYTNSNRISGSSAGFDRALAVKSDLEGNVYITGASKENSTGFDIKTVKIKRDGTISWISTIDGQNQDDEARDLIVDTSGNVYVSGFFQLATNKQAIVIKFDTGGNVLWTDTLTNMLVDERGWANRMCFDSQGNIIVTGSANNPYNVDNMDFLTCGITTDGRILWKEHFDGTDHGNDEATGITSDNNGNIYVTGQAWMNSELQTVTIKYRTDYFTEPPAVDTPSTVYLFYPNSGQLVDVNDSDVTDSVHYYTIHHCPQIYFGYGQMNLVWNKLVHGTTVDTLQQQRVDVSFLNSTNPTKAFPLNEVTTSDYLNYFLPQCPNGITNVNGNGSLLYTSVYENVDVMFSSNEGGIKLLYICNPGANLAELGLSFEGQENLSIDQNWGLKVHSLLGDYIFERPRVYQLDSNNNRITLNWAPNWDLNSTTTADFINIGSYDNTKTLVIEIAKLNPSNQTFSVDNIEWSTYVSGSSYEELTDMVTDTNGNLYVCGITESSNFPIVNGFLAYNVNPQAPDDCIIARFDLVGDPITHSNLKWSTFYGSHSFDAAFGIDFNNSNNQLYIVGKTTGSDFDYCQDLADSNSFFQQYIDNEPPSAPLLNHMFCDGFIIRMSSAGNSVPWATFIGGADVDFAFDVSIKQSSNDIYVIGTTNSDGRNPSLDTILFPTKVSNRSANAYNQARSAGSVVTQLNGDGYVIRFNNNNEMEWSTTFGGKGEDEFFCSKILGNENLIISGRTNSDSADDVVTGHPFLADTSRLFPLCNPNIGTTFFDSTYNGGNHDAFVVGINKLDELIWSTYLGGTGDDQIGNFGNGLCTTKPNSSTFGFTGSSSSSDSIFPIRPISSTTMYVQNVNSGNGDAFMGIFDGYSLSWCTFYGGNYGDEGRSASFDANGFFYVLGSSYTSSNVNTCSVPSIGKFPICDHVSGWYSQNLVITVPNAFIAGFNPNKELIWSTYFSGGSFNSARSIEAFKDDYLYTGINETYVTAPTTPTVHFTNSYYHGPTGDQEIIISRFNIGILTGVDEASKVQSDFQLFPNPTHQTIAIQMKDLMRQINGSRLIIYNMLGSIVYSSIIQPSDGMIMNIDVSNYNAGVYVAQISNGSEIYSLQFIKE